MCKWTITDISLQSQLLPQLQLPFLELNSKCGYWRGSFIKHRGTCFQLNMHIIVMLNNTMLLLNLVHSYSLHCHLYTSISLGISSIVNFIPQVFSQNDWEQKIIAYFTVCSLQTYHSVFIILVQTQSASFAPSLMGGFICIYSAFCIWREPQNSEEKLQLTFSF